MRKVFISYSIEDRNLHLITLLLEHLRKNNYDVIVSDYGLDYSMRMLNASLFIGIITNKSNSIDYVVKEWQTAKKNNIQNILIVEEGVSINDSNISYIRFNRSNPQKAINDLFNYNNKSSEVSHGKRGNGNDLANAILGVAVIAGVAALISLLSEKK